MTSICGLHGPLLVQMPLPGLPAGRALAGHAKKRNVDQEGKSLSPVVTEITEHPKGQEDRHWKGSGTGQRIPQSQQLCCVNQLRAALLHRIQDGCPAQIALPLICGHLSLCSRKGPGSWSTSLPLISYSTVPLMYGAEYGEGVMRGARERGEAKLFLVLPCKSHSPHPLTCLGWKPGSMAPSLPKELWTTHLVMQRDGSRHP